MAKLTIKDTKEAILKGYNDALKLQQEAVKQNEILQEKANALSAELEKCRSAKVQTAIVQKAETAKPTPAAVLSNLDNAQSIIHSLTTVQQSIAHSLSSLSEEQVIEAEQIMKITEQIATEKAVVKELYDIDLNGNTFEELVKLYETEKDGFEERFTNKKKTYLEEATAKNEAWVKEQEETNRKFSEQNKEAQTNNKREQDEFDYKLKQNRSAEEDEYTQKRKKLAEELAEIKAQKEKEWADKEKELADKEAKFVEYKTKYDGLEAELQKEIKKAEAEGKAIIERDHKVKLALYQADVDAEQRSIALRIQSQEQLIKNQEEQVKKLTLQLENALKQAQSLAIKALEGSANSESFSAIREIAVEQAKGSNKSSRN